MTVSYTSYSRCCELLLVWSCGRANSILYPLTSVIVYIGFQFLKESISNWASWSTSASMVEHHHTWSRCLCITQMYLLFDLSAQLPVVISSSLEQILLLTDLAALLLPGRHSGTLCQHTSETVQSLYLALNYCLRHTCSDRLILTELHLMFI